MNRASIPAGELPIIKQQVVDIGVSSTQSVALDAKTVLVRVHCDAVCCIEFGANPTAVAQASMRMVANQTEYFGVGLGAGKIAVIAAT